jgi:hypothetical protein
VAAVIVSLQRAQRFEETVSSVQIHGANVRDLFSAKGEKLAGDGSSFAYAAPSR